MSVFYKIKFLRPDKKMVQGKHYNNQKPRDFLEIIIEILLKFYHVSNLFS